MRLIAPFAVIGMVAGCDTVFGLERTDASAADAPDLPTDVVELAVGARATCVRLRDGDVWCWGEGIQVASATDQPQPARIPLGTTPAIAVSSGDAGACAVLADGRALCWGPNSGALGVGDSTPHVAPVPAMFVNNVIANDLVGVAVGNEVTCFLRAGGKVACAGAARLVGNASATDQPHLADVDVVKHAKALATGDRHVCALETDGITSCWGDNDLGQLGIGTLSPAMRPVTVTGTYTAITAGDRFTCAIDLDERVACWGSNTNHELGDGTTDSKSSPNPVAVDHAVAIAGAATTAYAARDDGAVYSWGASVKGELGDGATVMRTTPGIIDKLPASQDVGAGTGLHACALTANRQVWCWGWNQLGQLGDGTTADSGVPVLVQMLP